MEDNFLVRDGVEWKNVIREIATRIGFIAVGFTDALPIEGLESFLQRRQEAGYYTSFEEKELQRRVNAKSVWESCETVIVLAHPLPLTAQAMKNEGVIARSAVSEDYHRVVTRALEKLISRMEEMGWNSKRPRLQVDTGPLNERAFAVRAGIGWIGRNQQLIIPQRGSFFSLALMLVDQELPSDYSIENQCGGCNQCIEACPTKIIGKPMFEANRCLSYLTQTKDVLSHEQVNQFGNRLFGCDTCQEACPHNQVWLRKEEASGQRVRRGEDLWEVLNLTKSGFNEKFRSTAAGWRGKGILQRNAYFALSKQGDPELQEWQKERKKSNTLPPIIQPYIKE